MAQELIKKLIEEIEVAYEVGHIGHTLYVELISKARELQITI